MEPLVFTTEMAWVLGFLALTVALFASDVVRVDVAALIVLALLALTTVVPARWIPPLLDPARLFSGFSSNAVISVIGVMILGASLEKTGAMNRVAAAILRAGGKTERRIVALVSAAVGGISSFMQNVGAAALFLPVVKRISARTGLPMSRLLMPMGFSAILGGTLTMVSSGPLILLNDLILAANPSLEAHGLPPMRPFGLLAVAPVGLALLATGIAWFVLAGTRLLPGHVEKEAAGAGRADRLRAFYGVDASIFEVRVPAGSGLAGRTVAEVEAALAHRLTIVAVLAGGAARVGPGRDHPVPPGAAVALLGPEREVAEACAAQGLERRPEGASFSELLGPSDAGVAELVVPPQSRLVGQTLDALRMRQTRGLAVLAVLRCGQPLRERLRDLALQAGDTLLVHGAWVDLAAVERERRDFVVLDAGHPRPDVRPHKLLPALACFLGALALILLADVRPSIAMIAGAVGAVVTGVLSIDEAYDAVSWKTVFLLAALIPLGQAVESTGTADWIAGRTIALLGEDVGPSVLQAAVAVLATAFTLLMSNVGATVLLVPLAVNLAVRIGAEPAVFALTVAISTSNAFVLPTHQVSALIMGPGGYRVADFMRAGGVLTVLFWIVSLTMLRLVF